MDASVSFFYISQVFAKALCQSSPCFAHIGYATDDISGECKAVSDFSGSIGSSEILAMLEIKGQVLHRVRLRLKVPG